MERQNGVKTSQENGNHGYQSSNGHSEIKDDTTLKMKKDMSSSNEKDDQANGGTHLNGDFEIVGGRDRSDTITKQVMQLHWDMAIPRRGLGDLITAANHIAITVKDIGRSLWFYSDVIGFQQIRRPNFDRHGAWLTMGNIELHLILGNPTVHSGDDLIVGHIALETNNIQGVLKKLKEMEIPFETNVSVPKANETEGVVTQFFLRDPDGYYIEICNCGVLTDFCLGNEKVYVNGYVEGAKNTVEFSILSKMALTAKHAKKRVQEEESDEVILNKYDHIDGSDVVVDEQKLENLLKRTKIYGDVIQGECRESLIEALKKTNNNVPEAVLYIQAKHGSNQVFQPPTIYRNNEEAYTPPTIMIDKNQPVKNGSHKNGH